MGTTIKQSESTADNKSVIKESVVKIAIAVWILGFIALFFSLSVPPADLVLWAGLFCIALIPALLGVRRYRAFGLVAVFLTLLFIGLEVLGDKQIKAQRAKAAARADSTNSPAVGQQ